MSDRGLPTPRPGALRCKTLPRDASESAPPAEAFTAGSRSSAKSVRPVARDGACRARAGPGLRVPREGAFNGDRADDRRSGGRRRTNDEVAAALSLSPRTVQWNLSKIYRKVGVRSRMELAAALARVNQARER
jgi:hypothetical protein